VWRIGLPATDRAARANTSAVHVCVQNLPPDGQLFTSGLAIPSLVFACAGAVAMLLFHNLGTYRAIRDDEVFEVGRMLKWSRISYTFTTDIPLFLMQLYVTSVG
jgi:hypothetical protein